MAIDSFTRQQMTELRRLMRQLDKQAKQRATVIHEAGHAVVHHVMGMRVIRATIIRRGGSAERVKAARPYDRVYGDTLPEYIVGTFAGYWAEKLLADPPLFSPQPSAELRVESLLRCCRSDFAQVDQALNELLQARRLAGDDCVLKLRRELKEVSRLLVLEHQTAILTFAERLFIARKMECDEIREMLERLTGVRHVEASASFPSPVLTACRDRLAKDGLDQ